MCPSQSCQCIVVVTLTINGIPLDSTQITPGHDIHDFKSSVQETFLNKMIKN